MAVADDLAAQGKRKNGRWARGSVNEESRLSADWAKAMQLAGLVIDWCPELVDPVIHGDIPLNGAATQAEYARDAQAIAEAKAKREAEMLADLKDNRPDLAALVDEGKLPLADALTVRDKETADQRRAEREAEEQIQKFSVGVCSAFVEEGEGRGKSVNASSSISPQEFAALGITGLRSKDTVRRYLRAWTSTVGIRTSR